MISGRARQLALCFSLGLSLFALSFAGISRANGRFPAASQLVVDTSNPKHIFVSSTYGLLVSNDAGGSWSHVCEAAYGSTGTQDSPVAVMNGTLLAGLYSGLSVALDGTGCSFDLAGGPLTKATVIDVAIDKGTPSHAVAVASTALPSDSGFAFDNVLTESLDNGKSFHLAGAALAEDLEVLTVDTAASDPDRLYVSGISVASSQNGLIERSDDRGAHWARLAIAESPAGSLPFIAAVDPVHEDTLYVRVTRGPEALLVSTDGGKAWRSIFSATSPILGFALSPDSSQIAVGTGAGIAVAKTSDYAFRPVNPIIVTCLTWSEAGLLACAKESTTGFSIGLSEDEGAHFRALYHLNSYCGPACPAGSPTEQACRAVANECTPQSHAGTEAGDAAAGTSASGDAGSPASGGNGGDNESGGVTDAGALPSAGMATVGGAGGSQTKASGSSCSCYVVGSRRGFQGAPTWLFGVLCGFGWLVRRRR